MKKTILSLVVLIIVNLAMVSAQTSYNAGISKTDYSNLPQEKIFVHHNASLLFTGEYLFYKVYCINANTNEVSKLSKVAYIELIGEGQKSVFKHKIALNKGLGQGDFFIPNSVPSGNYKLIAYTQWMQNFGVGSFFQADLSIINPYRGDQQAILTSGSYEKGSSVMNYSEKNNSANKKDINKFNRFKLLLNERKFKKREKVKLSFRNFANEKGFGNYSLSVRKIDVIPVIDRRTSEDYDTAINDMSGVTGGTAKVKVYAPELKGTIVSGKVMDKTTGLPAVAQNVAISISGDYFFFKVTMTDVKGEFDFSLDPFYDKDNAIVEVVSDSEEKYSIELYQQAPIDFSDLSFASFKIDATMKQAIEKRSIYNQIENGYFSIKPDTIKAPIPKKPFIYYERKTKYNLDDYTRFSSMEDVFKEIVKAVWTKKDGNGNSIIKVFNRQFSALTDNHALTFIDGVFVQDASDVLAYNARKIQEITVIRNEYQFGTQDYQGVILIETIAGDYENNRSGDYVTDVLLFKPERKKTYFHQDYDERNALVTHRIPDFRTQLLWEPDIALSSSEMNFSFYTSDNPGRYEISLEGFTSDGMPVSLQTEIMVEE